jgi:hypothetical protein
LDYPDVLSLTNAELQTIFTPWDATYDAALERYWDRIRAKIV